MLHGHSFDSDDVHQSFDVVTQDRQTHLRSDFLQPFHQGDLGLAMQYIRYDWRGAAIVYPASDVVLRASFDSRLKSIHFATDCCRYWERELMELKKTLQSMKPLWIG